ncbi:Putative major facilitator superfamily, MFS transporter superfamily [Colletotrichum destructivum]|uniref:Major facilitator superfamily, MFS transporter superfamily n=1 Tax=Colletotrichum destructivum TaxID=34406 RepID=A0AAX4J2S0_9PEZI|nr:Putative major facilitator superfamily, MFS transporter superfamily [Colletotrichum destructivum]
MPGTPRTPSVSSAAEQKGAPVFPEVVSVPQASDSKHHAVDQVWAAGASAQMYEPIPEYEGRHRYDPTATWSEHEEKKLVRRLDYRICSWVCLMFFALQLDRGNINQANTDNMLEDLGLTTNQYNYGMTIFYVCFLCAELPSQMISKKLGPDRWVPAQMVSWSIVAACQCLMTEKNGFYATRALLGLIEGGFIPDAILYLSYFYTSKELPIRMSYFYCSSNATQIIAAFLAFGILHLRGVGGWEGWRWLFALEGGLTALIGVVSWFYLPPSPTQTASRFRGKDGWFSEREEIIMVNRILRDDPSKGGMHNRQGLTLRLLWSALSDWDLWPIYLYGFTLLIPVRPIDQYLTINLKALGFDTFQANLLTIPGYVLFLIQLVFWSRVSERWNNRMLIVFLYSVWVFPLVLALELMPAGSSPWKWYAVTALIVGYPYVHSILVSLTSRNAGTVRTRTVGSAIYNMTVQASSIIGSNIYQKDDAPLYRRGNKIILALIAWNAVLAWLIKAYYMKRNKTRDGIWGGMSQQEKDHYLATTKDEGSRRLDFRFAH